MFHIKNTNQENKQEKNVFMKKIEHSEEMGATNKNVKNER